jgi:Flp pilus assembly pilin Flp
VALAGSTATELGLIGAVVLVATLGFWFLLGDGLKQAFGLVKSGMLAQVSNAKANGMTVDLSEPPNEPPSSTSGDPVLDLVDPPPTVVTAGSNGTEAHAETYNALQALIERSLQKETMTEAQADILGKLVKQLLHSAECDLAEKKAHEAYMKSYAALYELNFYGSNDRGLNPSELEDAFAKAYNSAEGSYESAEAAFLGALSTRNNPYNADLDKQYVAMAKKYTDFIKNKEVSAKNRTISQELDAAAKDSGLLNDPEVSGFIAQVRQQAFQIFMGL